MLTINVNFYMLFYAMSRLRHDNLFIRIYDTLFLLLTTNAAGDDAFGRVCPCVCVCVSLPFVL